MMIRRLLLVAIVANIAFGQQNMDWSAPLPPAIPWSGKSEALIVDASDPWITPSEQSGLTTTPTYDETFEYLNRLVQASPILNMVSLGKSAQGRDIWMVIASGSGATTPVGLKRDDKPILLAQAGIHSGEIDGKDAGLMLLRDISVRGTKADLLTRVNLLFIPILSVDAHERRSPYNRINQRGPVGQGWRTNSRNLNINRDWGKLDTEEAQAVVKAINQWAPDLYLDLHVTDGIDYQYDITFGYVGTYGWSPAGSGWLDDHFTPRVTNDLEAMGHIPGGLVFAIDNNDPGRGNNAWASTPRYSDGYGAARHLPTVLLENHSLKPYRQRVLGTYVFLEASLRTLARHGAKLRRATSADKSRESKTVVLSWKLSNQPAEIRPFKAVEWKIVPSDISGGNRVIWTGKPVDMMLPDSAITVASVSVRRPKAYWIPPAWSDVIARLRMHGIFMEQMTTARMVNVELDRLSSVVLAPAPFEGHMRVTAVSTPEPRKELFPSGSVRVPTSQPLGDLAIQLLEPQGPDSFFKWGFFLEILQRSEYVEGYMMEPLAERMLAADPTLKREFEAAIAANADFAANPYERLQWLYKRTPYYDERHNLYPIGRER